VAFVRKKSKYNFTAYFHPISRMLLYKPLCHFSKGQFCHPGDIFCDNNVCPVLLLFTCKITFEIFAHFLPSEISNMFIMI
jgi:hypothetical protein